MDVSSSISVQRANRANSGASSKRSDLHWFDPVIVALRGLWPVKTAQNLAYKANVSERAASFWLAGKYDMSLEAARTVLRSEEGLVFLTALMGEDCDARWWKRVKLNAAAAETRRALNEQAKKLDRLRAMRELLDDVEE